VRQALPRAAARFSLRMKARASTVGWVVVGRLKHYAAQGLAALALLLAGGNVSHAQAPVRTTVSPITQEIIAVATPDGLQLPGVLMTPAAGFNSANPAIVFLPDGPGVSPLRSAEPSRYLAEAMAARGYTALSFETRLTSRYAFSRFDESITDAKAALDVLSARGVTNIILAGHGLGALVAARALNETREPRLRGLLLISPGDDVAVAWRKKVGEDRYTKTLSQANAAIADGGRAPLIDLGDGIVATPMVFLDWYGPNAKTSLASAMAGLDRPIIMLAGEADTRTPRSRLDALKASAPQNKKIAIKTYPGVGMDLSSQKELLVTDLSAWMNDNGWQVAPRTTTQLVSTTAADGTKLDGVLYRPAAGGDTSRPAFLLVHGWASDVMRSTSQWLSQRLAQNGFAVLAVQHRGSGFRGTVSGRMEDVPQDLAAWSAFLGGRGYRNLVGVGHSVGGLWLSDYVAQSQDPRIKALIYLAPTRDLPMHARLAMGEDRYARTVLEAQDAVRDGKGATHLINAPFPQTVYDEDSRQPMFLSAPGSGFTYYYADAFLSYWGPASRALHTRIVPNVKRPILSVGGSRDPTMQGGFLIRFTEAAGPNARYLFYGGPGGATLSFEGFEARLTADITVWVGQTLP
jgi:pimeloyl-ACP methyl ester carboxylesterase